jgi:hypothetical protein
VHESPAPGYLFAGYDACNTYSAEVGRARYTPGPEEAIMRFRQTIGIRLSATLLCTGFAAMIKAAPVMLTSDQIMVYALEILNRGCSRITPPEDETVRGLDGNLDSRTVSA